MTQDFVLAARLAQPTVGFAHPDSKKRCEPGAYATGIKDGGVVILVALIVAGYVTLNAAVVAVLYLARTGERRRETEERHRRSIQPE